MKRVLRRIPMFFCLALSVGVVAIWVRSYGASDRYRWLMLDQGGSQTVLHSGFVVTGMGGLGLYSESIVTSDSERIGRIVEQARGIRQYAPTGYSSSPRPRYPMRADHHDESSMSSMGFAFNTDHEQSAATDRRRVGLAVPLWAVFGLTMAYPLGVYIAGVVRRQQEDRLALGLCPGCGVALPELADRCPVCNRIIHSDPAAAKTTKKELPLRTRKPGVGIRALP